MRWKSCIYSLFITVNGKHTKGYSLVAERWSSTPHVWVRFLLPLNLIIFPQPSGIKKSWLNRQPLKNKKVSKQIRRLLRCKRVFRRWRSWFSHKNRSRLKIKAPLWMISKRRYKADVRSQFLIGSVNNLGLIKRKKRRIRRWRRYRRWRYSKPKLFRKSNSKRNRKWLRGSYRRFFLPQHSASKRLGKIPFFRYLLRNRKFFKLYKFSRNNRTLFTLLKICNRVAAVSSKVKGVIKVTKLTKITKLTKLTLKKFSKKLLFTKKVLNKLPSYRPRRSMNLSKKVKNSFKKSKIQRLWRRKKGLRSSIKLSTRQLFFYTLLWKPSQIFKFMSSSSIKLDSELTNLHLQAVLSINKKQINNFNYPRFSFLILTSLYSHLQYTKSNLFQFLYRFKQLAQILVNYDIAKLTQFSSNRRNLLNYKKILTTTLSKVIIKSETKNTILRRLYKGINVSRRRKPKQRGYVNGRLIKHYSKLRSLRLNKDLTFLTRLSFIGNLNKLFVRSLKTKLTHYRISRLEFFTNHLIRLNPRHVVYNTSKYKYPFVPITPQTPTLGNFNLYNTLSKKLSLSNTRNVNTINTPLGIFNSVLFLSNSQLFSGYANNNRRRRKLRRRRWQFKKCFIRCVYNTSVKVYKTRPNRLVLHKKQYPVTAGNKNTNTIVNLVLTSKFLHNCNYLINYLGFSLFSLSKQNWNSNIKNLTLSLSSELGLQFFNNRVNIYNTSNLIPRKFFRYNIKRKLLKLFKFHKFSQNVVMWYYNMLIRFMEFCSGKKISIRFNPFLENHLSLVDLARCSVWNGRVRSFQRILGPKIFLNESLKILCLSIRHKDPTFLSNWLRGMLYRMSFWKYRLLFRYLKFLLRYLFYPYFNEMGFKGFKLRLKGKISVAGNARTRTLHYAIGQTSYSQFNHRIVSDYSTINTFTGVLGFRIWFFF